ncbi:MAG: acyltransferase [Caulobacteraceae bacterium]|nr:acyltransferase [Caulobacteraceae bacterium]
MAQARLATLSSIQMLRGVAALSVVLYHVSRVAGREISVLAGGVDLFFVLSGFILWTASRQAPLAPGPFLLRRAVRVLPLYWLLTLGVTLGALALPARFSSVHPEPVHVGLSLLLIPHFDPSGGSFPIIPVGWTLSYEAVFYLILAACLKLAMPRRLKVLSLVLVCIPICSLAWPPAYQLIANPMLLELATGVWLAELRLSGRWASGDSGGALIATSLIIGGLIAFAMLEAAGGGWDLWRPFLWGPPAAAILAGAVMLEDAGVLPRLSWLERAGDASYSLYLTQDLTIGAVLWTLPAGSPVWALAVVAFLASLAIGAACWALVERPLLKGLGRRLGARPRQGGGA